MTAPEQRPADRKALRAGALLLCCAVGTLLATRWSLGGLNDPAPPLARMPLLALAPGATPVAPLARRVVLIIADGLRADRVGSIAPLAALARRGIRATVRAPLPTFSTPSYVTWLAGLEPVHSGVRTNRYRGSFPLDSILAAAAESGWTTLAFEGGPTPVLQRIFPAHLRLALMGEGAWPRALAELPRARLAILTLTEADNAGHRHGARDPRYEAALRLIAGKIAAVIGRLDLRRDLLVVMSDHGHLPAGGHGGGEEEIRRLILVAAGPGIPPRPETVPMDQRDLAPSLAAMIGVRPPRHNRGWFAPWTPLAALAPGARRAVVVAQLATRQQVERFLAPGREGLSTSGEPARLAAAGGELDGIRRLGALLAGVRGGVDATSARLLRRLQGQRLLLGGGVLLALILGALVLVRRRWRWREIRAASRWRRALLLAPLPLILTVGLLLALGVHPSFSTSGSRGDLLLRLALAGGGAALAMLPAVRLLGCSPAAAHLGAGLLSLLGVGVLAALTPVSPGAALPDLAGLAARFYLSGALAVQLGAAGLWLLAAGIPLERRRD